MEDIPQTLPDSREDRRRTGRSIRTFRAACIEIDGKAYTATMKDFSEFGSGFEGKIPVTRGDIVRYRWGSSPLLDATVAWVDGSRFGLENATPFDMARGKSFPYRSVRIPLAREAAVFVGGRCVEGSAINIAQKGFCLSLTERVPQGCLSTLEIGGNVFENTTLRWTDGAHAGFALDRPMSIPDVAAFTNDD
ncbi:MAG: hypothetical protein V3R15_02240 [Qipengyuania citrea]